MRIGPSLILASRQTLAMTPQLQQAIKLLQFSHLELAAFIQQELEKNPLLQESSSEDGPIVEREAPCRRCADRHGRGAGRCGAGPGRGRRSLDARVCRSRRRRRRRQGRPARGCARCAGFRRRAGAVAGVPCARADRDHLQRPRRSPDGAEARRGSRRSGLLPPRGAGDRRRRSASAWRPSNGCGRGCARSSRPACSRAAWRNASARSSPSAIASIRR